MEVIATTSGGVLIQASISEVKEIITSVTGQRPKEILIGQKIPAIDYASTITKIKTLSDENSYVRMIDYFKTFSDYVQELDKSIRNAEKINI